MWSRLSRIVGLAVLLAGVCGLGSPGCSKVEGTGRSRLLLTSVDQENQMGEQAYRQILAEEGGRLSRDPQLIAMVQRIGQRLAAAAPDKGFVYEFHVIDSPTVNAFCLPGGKVAVYTGILPVCQTEAGLAAVMGHEIAHAIARHGGERVSSAMLTDSFTKLLAASAAPSGGGAAASASGNSTAQAFQTLAQLGYVLPHSRTQELEADELGMMYMAAAGYDPREAADVWRRMAASKGADAGGTIQEFTSTHPADDRRIRELDKKVEKALELYEKTTIKFGRGEQIPPRYLVAPPPSATPRTSGKRPKR